jgi:serine/threonine protein kinase
MSHHQEKQQTDDFSRRLFFNKYKPVKKLGEGSFGKIYSAININNKQKFALKMVTYNFFIFNKNNINIGIKRSKSKFIRIGSIYIMLFKRM